MDEPHGTPLLTGEEEVDLQDPEQFLLPTRAELEAKNDDKPDEADGIDTPKTPADTPGDGDGESDEAPEVDDGGSPLYHATLPDPGEFQPQDHSFDVTVYDEEGKGKTKTIKTVDDWDALLDTDPNLGSAAALLKAQRLATKMESALEREQQAHEAAKQAYEAEQASVQQANEAVTALENEMAYLVDKGHMPAVAKKYQQADWSDPEVAKQPGVKEQLALMDYMKKENAARQKAGIKPFGSLVDAWNQYDRDQARQALKKQADKTVEARRQVAGRVGSPSPAPVSNIPKGVMVGRSLGSLDNLG